MNMTEHNIPVINEKQHKRIKVLPYSYFYNCFINNKNKEEIKMH